MTSIEELSKKTVMELKSYAKNNNIDLYGVRTKFEILEVIGSFIPPTKKEIVETKPKGEINTAAVYSTRNLYWNGIGSLNVGYNIVSEENAEKWITHKSVRKASAEEVAREYVK